MPLRNFQFFISILLTVFFHFNSAVHAVNDEKPLQPKKAAEKLKSYAPGDKILVECLNRTIDTGEHITNAKGELQYIPFPICNETGRPLELIFGSEKDINCTIPTLPDPLFHLFEFYIHNDAPLSCRLPSRPASSALSPPEYTHLQVALTGTLQLSHLHINPSLNILIHTTPSTFSSSKADSEILAATAYSLPSSSATSYRLVIGDPLPLQLSVRWYTSRVLPASTSKVSGLGGHVHLSTVMYCLLSFGAGGAVSLAYWRGWELPRRMRRYKGEMVGGEGARGYAWPGSAGNGFVGGKRD